MLWFDLDNSPHVLLFRPIFKELDDRGIKYIITARDFAQTLQLLNYWKIHHYSIGKHGNKNKLKKVGNLLYRSLSLVSFIKEKNVKLAISHGSRSQVCASRILRIPSIVMMDYEFTESRIFNYLATYMLWPEIIPDERLKSAKLNLKKILRYPCFKEEIYLSSFKPDPYFRKSINIEDKTVLIFLRTPAMVSNYHNKNSEHLILMAINHFTSFDNTICLISARTKYDKNFILKNINNNLDKVRFLEKPVDGLQLLYHSDIVISGGGTMNRESALLGSRTYSIFSGRRPYLDEYLAKAGKLSFINSVDDICKIYPERIIKNYKQLDNIKPNVVKNVVDIILEYYN